MVLHSSAAGLHGHPRWGATAASLGRMANLYSKGIRCICQIGGSKEDEVNPNQGLGMTAEASLEYVLSEPEESTEVAT